MGSLFVNVVV